jgi:hypothetical protein
MSKPKKKSYCLVAKFKTAIVPGAGFFIILGLSPQAHKCSSSEIKLTRSLLSAQHALLAVVIGVPSREVCLSRRLRSQANTWKVISFFKHQRKGTIQRIKNDSSGKQGAWELCFL